MVLDRGFWPIAAAIVLAAGGLQLRSALRESQTWDEAIHLSAGSAYLQRGDYSWNMEHPPLAKLLSALPALALHATLPVDSEGWKKHDQAQMGLDFLYRNRVAAEKLLLAGRSMTILLSMLFLTALAWWTRRRYGAAAALLALALCAFDPNLLAHGHYITTDFPVTVFYFFACAHWLDYLEENNWRRLLAAALAIALALTTKYSAILLIPTLPVLYLAAWIRRPLDFPLRRMAQAAGTVLAVLVVVVAIVYWPETVRCLGTDAGRLFRVVSRDNFVGRSLYILGLKLHLPAHRFFLGLDAVAKHNAGGHASYLMGLRSETGWWYYFPVVFAVKSTIAALIATAIAFASWRSRWRAFALLFPPLLYFVMSMTGGINIGARHILPVYPFLYVAAAAALSTWMAAPQPVLRRAALAAMLALGFLQALECASITPHYLAFFNRLAGGPGNGPRYLVDSNIDWGQDFKNLRAWLESRGTRKAYTSYFNSAPITEYGIEDLGMPAARDRKGWDSLDGYVAVSVTPLQGVYVPLEELAPLRLREPIAKVGWSIYVYDFRKPDKMK